MLSRHPGNWPPGNVEYQYGRKTSTQVTATSVTAISIEITQMISISGRKGSYLDTYQSCLSLEIRFTPINTLVDTIFHLVNKSKAIDNIKPYPMRHNGAEVHGVRVVKCNRPNNENVAPGRLSLSVAKTLHLTCGHWHPDQ